MPPKRNHDFPREPLPASPDKTWKEQALREYKDSGWTRSCVTVDKYGDDARWQADYDFYKKSREGHIEIEVRQNRYLIDTWGLFLPNLLVGVYHTGVHAFGLGEYSFDNEGIYRLSYDEVRDISELRYKGTVSHKLVTNLNAVEEAVWSLQAEFPPGSYDLLNKNCHHFCDALAAKLGLPPLDKRYTRAARAYKPIHAFQSACASAASEAWNGLRSFSSALNCCIREDEDGAVYRPD